MGFPLEKFNPGSDGAVALCVHGSFCFARFTTDDHDEWVVVIDLNEPPLLAVMCSRIMINGMSMERGGTYSPLLFAFLSWVNLPPFFND